MHVQRQLWGPALCVRGVLNRAKVLVPHEQGRLWPKWEVAGRFNMPRPKEAGLEAMGTCERRV